MQAQETSWIFHFKTLNQKIQPHINNEKAAGRDKMDALIATGGNHYK